MRAASYKALCAFVLWASTALCITIDVDSQDSICNGTSAIVRGEMDYYLGIRYGGTVGMFTSPYYWWNAGEVFGGWVDYWAFCASDNDTFTDILYEAMYAQRGSNNNYMPSNQSMTEGNDDQGVWGMAIMQAVERNFTNPESHSWLYLVQALFNSMNNRWDTSTCNGGLRWQIFTWNNGYNYKNSIANGCLFHLAARLYRYTGDDLYLEVAEKVYDWMWNVGFFANNNTSDFIINDGADDTDNCTDLTVHKWSYTYGIFMSGCAYLYNATEEQSWREAALQIVDVSSYFFNNSIMSETTCAQSNSCNNDQRSFRSLFSRCLGLTVTMMPETYDTIVTDWLIPSAKAAAQSCSGDGHFTCGENWSYDGWDGVYGLGEQMSALECILSLIAVKNAPLTPETGGTSTDTGDVSAGNDTKTTTNVNEITVSTGDKAGAAILTLVVLGTILGGSVWMFF